ncbi:MAG: YihY family inner membrane protein [Terrimonas sp.]|nr:YihY family inner membrane protein [Terrimonas sp.]
MRQLLKRWKNKVLSSAPIDFLIAKSKQIVLPGFQKIALYDVTLFFYRQITSTNLTERASSIAFNLIMAIPPAIIFFSTLIPFFPISHQFTEQLHQLIRDIIPGEKNNTAIIAFIDDFIYKPKTGLLSFGLLLALYFSTNTMMGISHSFNRDYIGFTKRKNFHNRWVAVKLTVILFLLVILCVLLLVMQGYVLDWLGIENKDIRALLINGRWVAIILLFFFIISFIYRYAPAVQKKWGLMNPGSILATFLMLVFTIVFTYWVNHFSNYNKLYGSIGTIMMLMVLIYFNSIVLLIGFELNVSISSLRKLSDDRKKT